MSVDGVVGVAGGFASAVEATGTITNPQPAHQRKAYLESKQQARFDRYCLAGRYGSLVLRGGNSSRDCFDQTSAKGIWGIFDIVDKCSNRPDLHMDRIGFSSCYPSETPFPSATKGGNRVLASPKTLQISPPTVVRFTMFCSRNVCAEDVEVCHLVIQANHKLAIIDQWNF